MLGVVIDTNIVLDMWVFDDPRSRPLDEALRSQGLRWLASAEMREELLRVLSYPHLVQRMVLRGVSAPDVLAQFDLHAHSVPSAERAPYVCNDTKDKEVLRMKNRLARLGVVVLPVWSPPA